MVMAGKDRGRVGKVQQVLRDKNSVLVEGLNLMKKHVKKTEQSGGGVVTIEAPLHVSKVSVLDPTTKAPCRIAFRFLEDGTRVRVSRGGTASGSVIPRPEALKERRRPLPSGEGLKDTPAAEAHAATFDPAGGPGLPPLRKVDGRWELARPPRIPSYKLVNRRWQLVTPPPEPSQQA